MISERKAGRQTRPPRRAPALTDSELITTRLHRLRQVVNLINLSTALGLLVAMAGRAEFSRGPGHMILATSIRIPLRAGAMTIGDVVLTRKPLEVIAERPALLRHELRHCTQYAWCVGPVMLALYGLAAAWSWALTGDAASRNVFERRAGLVDGSYVERPLRPLWRRRGRARAPRVAAGDGQDR